MMRFPIRKVNKKVHYSTFDIGSNRENIIIITSTTILCGRLVISHATWIGGGSDSR